MDEKTFEFRERILLVAEDIEKLMTKELAYEYLLKEIRKGLYHEEEKE
jgi:hypothetical protein